MKKETMIKPKVGVIYECYMSFTDRDGDRCRKGQKFVLYINYIDTTHYCMDKASGRGTCIVIEKDKFTSHFVPVETKVVDKVEYKIGDVVRVIEIECGHGFKIGQEVTVIYCNPKDHEYKCSDGNDYWFLHESEIELAEQAKPESYIDTDKKLNQIYMIEIIKSIATPEQIQAVAEIIPGLKEQLVAQYPELFITHKAGNHYFNENDVEFVMATQLGHYVALVNLETGTLGKTVHVADINNLTDTEFKEVCGGNEYSLV